MKNTFFSNVIEETLSKLGDYPDAEDVRDAMRELGERLDQQIPQNLVQAIVKHLYKNL